MRFLSLTTVLAGFMLVACGGAQTEMAEMSAVQIIAPQVTQASQRRPEYRIGVGDKLNIRVFQVADLSFDDLVVDTSGNVQMPLIGSVSGAGRTSGEMATDIATRLSQQYLRNPQVTVTVVEAASQKITVDGAVTKPGVYEMQGAVSLLQAVAMAEGPTRVADTRKVAVFRVVDGQRSVALFDLAAIRQGSLPDPQVFGDDIIVVDTSRLSVAMREVIGILPAAVAIFRPY